MRSWITRDRWSLMVLAGAGILTLWAYPRLGDRLPIHFNLHGTPDRWVSPSSGIGVWLGLLVLLYALMTWLPRLDPFWEKIRDRYDVLLLMRDLLMVVMVLFYAASLYAGIHGTLPPSLLAVLIGMLFLFVGNLLPRLPRNFFFGIRTPWTLASDRVWRKSHRMGGILFLAVGVAFLLIGLFHFPLSWGFWGLLLPLILWTGVIYPYWVYKKEHASPDLD